MASPADAVQVVEAGRDDGRGNLVGVQPWITPADYASETTLYGALSAYLDAARERGWLGPRTVVVWPEYLGTWLIVAGAGRAVARAKSLDAAMRRFALRHVAGLVRRLWSAREPDRVAATLFRVRAPHVTRLYHAVFSHLAREFQVTLVAGSAVLPSPRVVDGAVVAGDGPLYGVSAVFGPDGRAYPDLVRKAYPIGSELPFLTPASPEDLPAFDTPAGRLGVLICADSWYPAPYERLSALGVDLIAVPSYIAAQGVWDKPWRGYDGAAAPHDVAHTDVGALTEAQAWRRYALAGRLAPSGARAGINVFLAGSMWDLGGEGGSLMVTAGRAPTQAESGRPALLNLWL